MKAPNGNGHSKSTNFTRRQFLAVSCAAASSPGFVVGAQQAEPAGTTEMPNIEPGYVGTPFFDKQEEQALLEVLESRTPFRFWGEGKPTKVARFEENFAKHMGTRFAVGVNSGTSALDCAVTGLGIGPGDEVILPAYTYWSDYTCVVHAGALPVFADIDATLTIDPQSVEAKITPRTKAIIAVHLLGGACNMDAILEIARQRKIAVLEDCAQCVGGSYQGRRLGSLGDVGIYSFQVNKTMTCGEGGAVVTSDPLIYERAVRFHDNGGMKQLFLDRTGIPSQVKTFASENLRMNEFTGAVLAVQLSKVDTMIAQLRQHATAVYEGIKDLKGIRLRRRPDPTGDIGYAVCFEVQDKETRDRCIQELRQRKVPASTLTGSQLLPNEESVINKRTRGANWPSFSSPEGKAIQYGPNSCVQTLSVFHRFVQVRVGVKYTQRIDDYIVQAIRAVCGSLTFTPPTLTGGGS
jgi:8-amino-3,8-dideoxy-alpha-D-manno-octulosonate transaminase